MALFGQRHLPLGGQITQQNVSGQNAADMPRIGAINEAETNHTVTSSPRSKAISRTAAEIELKPTDWLWRERVPMNAISVLAGEPGLGKSLLTIRLVAQLTRGDLRGGPEAALMLTAEDSLATVVRPRLEAAGTDLELVHFAAIVRDQVEMPMLLPNNLKELRAVVRESRARLVVVDPLMAHLPVNVDSWKDQTVRQALAPLH